MADIGHSSQTIKPESHQTPTIVTAPALVTMIETLNPSVHTKFTSQQQHFSNNAVPPEHANSESAPDNGNHPEPQQQQHHHHNNHPDKQQGDNPIPVTSSSSLSLSNPSPTKPNASSQESIEHNKLESSSELSFTKKDISKSRTQSFQSVLSTASLISLKQQALSSNNPPANDITSSGTLHRQNSIINGNNNTLIRSNSTVNNSKNFQSFIQAPVFSSFTNLKSQDDDIQIGQQLPFENKSTTNDKKAGSATSTITDTHKDETEEESAVSPEKLTLKALKKLSLSPRPITHPDDIVPLTSSKPKSPNDTVSPNTTTYTHKTKTQQPYQPAEVDLSSFASLTRQPKVNPDKIPSPVSNFKIIKKNSLPRLPEVQHLKDTSNQQPQPEKFQTFPQYGQSQQPQQQQENQPINTNQTPQRIPAAVIPPHDMNTRRIPSNPVQVNNSTNSSPPREPTQHHPQPQYSLNHPRVTRQLQQIKGLRSPMYVPCVLRMTNSGVIHSPTQMRSYSNSPELIVGGGRNNNSSPSPKVPHHIDSTMEPSYIAQLQMFGQGDTSSSRASIKSIDSNMSIESGNSSMSGHQNPQYLSSGNKGYDHLLKAPPTRRHWVKDDTVLKCSIPTCPKVFNFFERRHHCRKCGGIFCKEHTSHLLYINHLAQFTTGGRGTLSKVCDNCIEEYNEFIKKEFGVNVSTHPPSVTGRAAETYTQTQPSKSPNQFIPLASANKYVPQSYTGPVPPEQQQQQQQQQQYQQSQSQQRQPSRSEQVVGSVPANWSWSSF